MPFVGFELLPILSLSLKLSVRMHEIPQTFSIVSLLFNFMEDSKARKTNKKFEIH